MGFVNEIKTHKCRAWKCFCVALLFGIIGLQVGSLGVALVDIMYQVNTSIDQISRIFPMRAFGNLIGSTICGFASVHIDIQIILSVAMLFMTTSIFFVPLCSTLWELYVTIFFNGFFSGLIENAATCFIINAFGKQNGPFLQIMHTSFGFGTLISPLIMVNFLGEIKDLDDVKALNITSDGVLKDSINHDMSHNLTYPYFIIGALSTAVWLIYTITYFFKRSNKPHPTRDNYEVKIVKSENNLDQNNNEGFSPDSSKSKIFSYNKIMIVLLGAIFVHAIYGVEMAYGIMLPTYAQFSELKLTKKRGAYLNSVYRFTFTFFRLFCIVFVNYISARSMLIIDLVLMVVSNIILLPLIFYKSEVLLWGSSALMGVAVSSTIPCLFSYVETIISVTSKIASIINLFACLEELVLPIVIGAYLSRYPNIFIYIIFLYSGLACIAFGLSYLLELNIRRYIKN